MREEIFWKQRSRVQWLTEGDKNTTFFHKLASNHKRKNIVSKMDGEGVRVYKDWEEMGRHAVEYFSKAYIKDNNAGNQIIKRSLINKIPQSHSRKHHGGGSEMCCVLYESLQGPKTRWFPSSFFLAFLGGCKK